MSGWLGRKEGQGQISEDLGCLTKGVAFCPARRRSHGLLLSSEVMLPKWNLWEIYQLVLWGGPPTVLGWGWWAVLGVAVLPHTPLSSAQTHGFHPCWPKGYSTHVLLQDVYESPCTAAQRPQTFNRSTKVSLSGSSDPALCRGLISELFNFSSCRFSRCSFNGIFQPPLAGKFILSPEDWGWGGRGRALKCLGSGHCVTVPPSQAFSAFFYTVDFLRTVMGLPVATLQQLEAAVVTICNQTWSEVRPAPPLLQGCAGGSASQHHASRSCICSTSRGGLRPLRVPTAVGGTLLIRLEKWPGYGKEAGSQMRLQKPP